MTVFLAAPRSISLVAVSIGCILLSAMVASLLVSYNPTGFSFSNNGYSIGLGTHHEQPSLDHIAASRNQIEAPMKSADISEAPMMAPKLSNISNGGGSQVKCDLYRGKWIYNPAGPLYTNNTCRILARRKSCQGNGRPDKDYENWKWKPDQCHLPRFDGHKFLELMRNKTLAFVGDSLARNQMHSLLCILWQTDVPINYLGTDGQTKRWHFQSTSTTIVHRWSAWLVRNTPLPVPSASPRAVTVHLETPGESFMQYLLEFDVLVLSSGHWFTTEPTYLLDGKKPHEHPRESDIIKFYAVALWTAFKAIASAPDYAGLTIFRSYSPAHYNNGAWNSGGWCGGISKPSSNSVRSTYGDTMWKEQVAAVEKAAKEVKNRSRLRFMDITEMFGYRNDGHPGTYYKKVAGKVENVPEDCVHWCMPGPVDTWNEILLEFLKREI